MAAMPLLTESLRIGSTPSILIFFNEQIPIYFWSNHLQHINCLILFYNISLQQVQEDVFTFRRYSKAVRRDSRWLNRERLTHKLPQTHGLTSHRKVMGWIQFLETEILKIPNLFRWDIFARGRDV